MKLYSIKELEKLSGIKAHTIRIWEKRYELLHPERTETNIRLYNDKQLIKLLNVATLLSYGWKISKVSRLSEDELKSETEKWLSDYADLNYQAQVNGLINNMLAFDEIGFEKVFASSVLKLGLKETITKVVYPFLHKVGIMWRIYQASPAQEHFASCIITRKLYSAIDGLLLKPTRKERFLIFLPENEDHEIGILLSDYLIRSNGYHVLNLGTNLPYINLIQAIKSWKPDYILTFFITNRPDGFVQEYVDRLIKQKATARQILLAGSKVHFNNLQQNEQVLVLPSINALETFIAK